MCLNACTAKNIIKRKKKIKNDGFKKNFGEKKLSFSPLHMNTCAALTCNSIFAPSLHLQLQSPSGRAEASLLLLTQIWECVCDRNKSHQLFAQSLQRGFLLANIVPAKGWGEEAFRHIAWTKVGKGNTYPGAYPGASALKWESE